MNEQIKQFIKQATIYYPATKSSGEFSIFDKEKFAKLIVKECAKQVDGWYDDFENECADRKILKHFEVEENESFDRTASHMAGEYVSYDDLKDEPVAHRFKWEEKEAWQYGDGYDATGAPNDPDYFAYEPLYTHLNEDRERDIYTTGYWNGIAEGKKQYELYGAVWHDEHGYQFTATVGEKVLNDDRWIKLYRKVEK